MFASTSNICTTRYGLYRPLTGPLYQYCISSLDLLLLMMRVEKERCALMSVRGYLNVFHFKPTGLYVATLSVATKDLPSSPRCTPYDFSRDASSALLQLVNRWLNSTYSRSPAFRYGRKNTNPGDKNRTHDFRTSRCTGYLLEHSGDEGLYVCMYVWSELITKYGSTWYGCQSCSGSAEQGK